MTIGIAWVGQRKDGREHLYIAADSPLAPSHLSHGSTSLAEHNAGIR